jgi:hypothetical protein
LNTLVVVRYQNLSVTICLLKFVACCFDFYLESLALSNCFGLWGDFREHQVLTRLSGGNSHKLLHLDGTGATSLLQEQPKVFCFAKVRLTIFHVYWLLYFSYLIGALELLFLFVLPRSD